MERMDASHCVELTTVHFQSSLVMDPKQQKHQSHSMGLHSARTQTGGNVRYAMASFGQVSLQDSHQQQQAVSVIEALYTPEAGLIVCASPSGPENFARH